MAQSPDEIFDVVNEHDEVIGQARRADVHAQGLLHRAIHIFVFNEKSELLLQMRSAAKDEYPQTYTSSASGHVDSGEDYDAAAERELFEELGLRGPLNRLHKFAAGPETSNEHTVLYAHQASAEVKFNTDEVESVEYASLSEIRRRMQTSPDKFSPGFTTLFNWYFARDSSSG